MNLVFRESIDAYRTQFSYRVMVLDHVSYVYIYIYACTQINLEGNDSKRSHISFFTISWCVCCAKGGSIVPVEGLQLRYEYNLCSSCLGWLMFWKALILNNWYWLEGKKDSCSWRNGNNVVSSKATTSRNKEDNINFHDRLPFTPVFMCNEWETPKPDNKVQHFQGIEYVGFILC